ncbi:MAG: hypothetical protein PHC97_00220 [Patescibacteria group bacterium]|nr:hypothetical protein [Patescibacteria group bacterium]
MTKAVAEDLHERRVKKIIKKGVAEMKDGKTAVFRVSELIAAETNHLKAKDDARRRKQKKEALS